MLIKIKKRNPTEFVEFLNVLFLTADNCNQVLDYFIDNGGGLDPAFDRVKDEGDQCLQLLDTHLSITSLERLSSSSAFYFLAPY